MRKEEEGILRTILIISILIFAFSCGKSTEEKTDEVIDIALTYLSENECDDALDVLLDVGVQNNNGIYLQVLASAYACKAGFDEISFISADIPALVTTNVSTLMKSLSILSESAESSTDSLTYTSIRSGINTILNATSGNPSQVNRTSKFGPRRGADLGVQALILNIVNWGKFLRYYGNTDNTGVKGAGAGSNNCFLDYNDPRAQLIISGSQGGACVSNTDGHADLDQTTEAGKRRICEGIMVINNSLDILDNLDLSSISVLSKLEDFGAQVSSFKTAATAAGLGTIANMTSQAECEEYASVPGQLLDLEYFYALVFEKSLL
jgi:hypothetical protein